VNRETSWTGESGILWSLKTGRTITKEEIMNPANLYLYDIGKLAENLSGEFSSLSFEKFSEDTKKVESAARRFTIMRERWKLLTGEQQNELGPIDWSAVTGKWDREGGKHVGIDSKVLWETIVNKLPGMGEKVEELLKK
jgi:uncharacterized protein with HEPN domain